METIVRNSQTISNLNKPFKNWILEKAFSAIQDSCQKPSGVLEAFLDIDLNCVEISIKAELLSYLFEASQLKPEEQSVLSNSTWILFFRLWRREEEILRKGGRGSISGTDQGSRVFKKIAGGFSLLQQIISRMKDSTISMCLANQIIENRRYIRSLSDFLLEEGLASEPIDVDEFSETVCAYERAIDAYQSFIVVYCNNQTLFETSEKLRELIQVRNNKQDFSLKVLSVRRPLLFPSSAFLFF